VDKFITGLGELAKGKSRFIPKLTLPDEAQNDLSLIGEVAYWNAQKEVMLE
jgi:hypothetical protein